MAEAALERDVLLHQRIEVEAEWLRTPPDLADPAGGADDIEGDLQGRGGAGGVDHAVAAEAVALLGPGLGVADDDFAAILLGDREAMGVLREADDGDLRAALLGHGGAEDADRAGSEDDHAVAGFDAGVLHDGVIGDAAGFGEAGLFEGEGVGYCVQDALRDADILGHRAVDAVAEALAGRVEVVEPAAGHRVVRRDDRGGLADHAVAFLPAFDLLAQLDDAAGELVAEDDRVVDRPGMVGGPLVEVAAADADVGDFEQDVFFTDDGSGDLADIDGALFGGEVYDGGGGGHRRGRWGMKDEGWKIAKGGWKMDDGGWGCLGGRGWD